MKEFQFKLEDRPGALAEVVKVMAEHHLSMHSIATDRLPDGTRLVRIIPYKEEKATEAFKEHGFKFEAIDVMVIGVPDKPGAFLKVLEMMAEANVNIDYVYTLETRDNKTYMVLHTDDPGHACTMLMEWL